MTDILCSTKVDIEDGRAAGRAALSADVASLQGAKEKEVAGSTVKLKRMDPRAARTI